jgi:hypothetical protein
MVKKFSHLMQGAAGNPPLASNFQDFPQQTFTSFFGVVLPPKRTLEPEQETLSAGYFDFDFKPVRPVRITAYVRKFSG